ncbi:CoA ester lyase [Dyella sp.]|uniref:HpcH/HpaI aldolase/citrate lyase family protein n=1 Tax=Dyella sp. TaxID=1869338 RepID=UPI002ED59B60
MKLRSLLFVPGDRADRMAKAQQSQADAVIFDLEDAVAADRKDAARLTVKGFLANEACARATFVRINPLDSGRANSDLEALAGHPPDGIVLPKACGREAIDQLDRLLGSYGLQHLPILPIATETAASVFELGSFRAVSDRLLGLTWGAEDLSAAVTASTPREADGAFTSPYVMVRALALFSAHAANVPAIETLYPDIRDPNGLARFARAAVRDGFSGMMAIHPAQVDIIHAALTPTDEEVLRARTIVDAFAQQPGTGTIAVDGKMLDAPHLRQAQWLLARVP